MARRDSAPQPELPPHPELGAGIITKSLGPSAILVGLMLLGLGGTLMYGSLLGSGWGTPGNAARSDWLLRIGGVVMGLLMGGMGVVLMVRFGDRFNFYELGVTRTRRGNTRAMLRYDQAEDLTIKEARSYHNGAYVGTGINMTWLRGGRRVFRYNGMYKEKMEKGGLKVWLKQKFVEGPREMDAVRDLAAFVLTPRWSDALARGETLELGKGHSANSQGLTPASGPMKGQLVSYASVEDMLIKDFKLHVMSGGQEIIKCPTDGKNFWPRFYAVQECWLAAVEASDEDAPERAPEM
ncbi:MAG: hypothetical protein GC200_02065 [Tepidisphaera sp.]|nr:hypothetical protein [Tepidisphaera sp.]